MKKEIFREFLTNSISEKTQLMNSVSDEDKTAIQLQIDNLTKLLAKLDELEADDTQILVDELKQTVGEMGEKLQALNERINQKQTETEKMENKNYLQTKNSVRDFAECVRSSKSAEEFRSKWNECLIKNTETISVEVGSEEAFVLPYAVKGMITDLWSKSADWLKDLNFVGARRFYCRYNTSAQTAETSRAKGHKKGETKTAQVLEMAAKLLDSQPIYKIAEIDIKTKFDSDEALLNYVLGELVSQILWEIKKTILVGDGREANDPNKISSFETIGKEDGDNYTIVSTVSSAANAFLVDDVRAMVDGIHNPNNKPVYVFMSKADLREISRVQASSTSSPIYMSLEQCAEQIGADRIITTDLLGDTYKAIGMIPNEYYMVGAPDLLNPLLYEWHDGWRNMDCIRFETFAGGGINGMHSTAVLLAGDGGK